MDFLKRLFGTNGMTREGNAGDPNGIYFYVRPNGCDEVVRVRIDRNNDLSMDDGGGLFVRKHVRGAKCRQPVEMTVSFDSSRRVVNSDLDGGVLVSEADYKAWREQEGA